MENNKKIVTIPGRPDISLADIADGNYAQNLENLVCSGIISPTHEQVQACCPHLNADAIQEIFEKSDGVIGCHFAVPGILVSNTYHVLRLYGSIRGDNLRLDWAFSRRAITNTEHTFSREALEFAQQNWGDRLIPDTWESVVKIKLQDPTDQTTEGDPKTKISLSFVTEENFNDIINDHKAPKSERLNESIMVVTNSVIGLKELVGKKERLCHLNNCAHCGGGLSISDCNGCGETFTDNGLRSSWATPLPEKLVEFAQKVGHTFAVGPTLAREKERKQWENSRKNLN